MAKSLLLSPRMMTGVRSGSVMKRCMRMSPGKNVPLSDFLRRRLSSSGRRAALAWCSTLMLSSGRRKKEVRLGSGQGISDASHLLLVSLAYPVLRGCVATNLGQDQVSFFRDGEKCSIWQHIKKIGVERKCNTWG